MVTQDRKEKQSFFSVLALKIIAAISISVLLIQLMFISFIESSIYESELSNIVDQQITFTEANAIYIAELVSEDKEDSLYLILSAIVANPLIVGATLQYADGREPLFVGEKHTALEYRFDIKDFNDNDELVPVGSLLTYATTAFIDESRSARITGILELVLLVFLVVLAVSVLAVQFYIGIPLRRITRAIDNDQRVQKIHWESRDEMGTVVNRLNFLHTKLYDQLTGLELELSASERREAARITSLANASLEGILIFNNDQIIDLNEPMAQLFSTDKNNLTSAAVSSMFAPDVLQFLNQTLSNNNRPVIGTELINSKGSKIPVEIYLHQLENHGAGNKVAVVRDISERVAAEQAMWRLAHYDSMTGLPNRRYFTENLNKAIDVAKQTNTALSVAYLDLDNFKFINDSRGHSVGDQLLCAVADSLQASLGSKEICARLGGDEFAILLVQNSQSSIEQILETTFNSILEGPHCQTWRGLFSVSIGVATLSGQLVDKNELLTRADLALYKAKELGRARICYYSEQLDVKLIRERLIVEKLVAAQEQDLLELYYQPQVLCDGSKLTGFEALLRWNDPELGTVSPEEIVHIAEREGMAAQLGRWVMLRAFREASRWPTSIRLAINLSPLELTDEKLPTFIAQCLKDTGLDAAQLEVEITETSLISESVKAAEIISALKAMGIKIALDDFGTGYSSLSMLQDFPFDRIKIDRSFVSNLSEDESKSVIVASIIDLGARLNLDVIAEGVESENDRATLLRLHCRECQGYLISEPVSARKVPEIINRYNYLVVDSEAVHISEWKKAG